MRPARKRSVTVILEQRENPLIEISAILTQCDRALTYNGVSFFARTIQLRSKISCLILSARETLRKHPYHPYIGYNTE